MLFFKDAQQNNNNYVRNSNHHHSRPPPSQTTTYKPATSFKNAAQNKFKSFFKSNKKPKKPIIHTTTTTTTATTTATSFKNNNPFLKTPVPVYLKSTTPPLYRPKRNKLRPGSAPTLSGTFAPTTPRPPPLQLTTRQHHPTPRTPTPAYRPPKKRNSNTKMGPEYGANRCSPNHGDAAAPSHASRSMPLQCFSIAVRSSKRK